MKGDITREQINYAGRLIAEVSKSPSRTDEEEARALKLRGMVPERLESLLGVNETTTLGHWKVRAGVLTREGANRFKVTQGEGRRFAFATCTLPGQYQVGFFFQEGAPGLPKEERYIGTPRFYLQSVSALAPGRTVNFQESTGGDFYPRRVVVNPDGTIPLNYPFPEGTKTVTWRMGPKIRHAQFDLTDIKEVYEAVKRLTVPAPRTSPKTEKAE